MEHVVFFPAPDGSPAFRRLTSIEEAVSFVEHLRNSEGVDDVTVHALTEVPLSFRPYYRVELPSSEPASSELVSSEPPALAPLTLVESPVVTVEPDAPAVAEVAPIVVPVLVPEQEPPAAAVAEEPAPSTLGFFARS